MTATGCPELVRLERLAEDAVPADERAELDAHVAVCASCATVLERVRADLVLEDRVRELFARGPATSAGAFPAIEGYRIVRELGRGGMGVVFEAEQISPPRRVALKIVRGGSWTDPSTQKLFQREIKVLARLVHPGIAQLYDAGSTVEGEHWFAMEIVRGEPLARHAATLARDLRLELFRQLCDAIDYAHERGVVHRDLKPSNVLVDLRGAVKVLDFGLAKITDDDVAATTLSAVGAIRGTLAYMSPEQARGDPTAIDLRSDVYSLGAILYELLTARVPSDVSGVHVHEAARRICEEAPARHASLRGDLETIVLRALEKEPARRYASAAALGEDVRRFLEHEPILARRPSGLYHARKLVARHRLATGLVLSIFVLAIGTAAWTSVLYARETGLRELADRERTKADREAESARVRALTAERAKDFVVGVFVTSDVDLEDKHDPRASELLERGLADIDEKLRDEPVVRAEMLETFGSVLRNLGQHASARARFEEAVLLRRAQVPSDPIALAKAIDALGTVVALQRETAHAIELHTEALEIVRPIEGDDGPSMPALLGHLAVAFKDAGDLPRAEALSRDVLARYLAYLPDNDPQVIRTKHTLAMTLSQQRRGREAAVLLEEILVAQRAIGLRSLRLTGALNGLGVVLSNVGDLERAEALLLEAIDLRTELVHGENPELGYFYSNLAQVYERAGRLDEALACYTTACDILVATHGEENATVAIVLHLMARLEYGRKAYAEAESLCRRAIEIRTKLLEPDHPDLVENRSLLANLMTLNGDWAGASAIYCESSASLERRFGPTNVRTALSKLNYGYSLAALGRLDEAASIMEGAYDVIASSPNARPAEVRGAANQLAKMNRRRGRVAEAERYEDVIKRCDEIAKARAP